MNLDFTSEQNMLRFGPQRRVPGKSEKGRVMFREMGLDYWLAKAQETLAML